MRVPPDRLRDFDAACRLEWLVGNALGGYASSTATGANTRRYHGLLIASVPPLRRLLVVSKLEEEIVIGGARAALSSNEYPGVIHPAGYRHLSEFRLDPFPVWRYQIEDAIVEKRLVMPRGRNLTFVRYHLLSSPTTATLHLRPLVNCRDHHGDTRAGSIDFQQSHASDAGGPAVALTAPGLPGPLRIAADRGRYRADPRWFHDMVYRQERERGLADREDHFSPGQFIVELAPGGSVTVALALGEAATPADMSAEEQRARDRVDAAAARLPDERARSLAAAADSFVISRPGDGALTLIAGYHWFGDWGRDTMIALPGLCLVTGRLAEARRILTTFARALRNGLVPNRFLESGGADYNTVDASLWFVNAVWKYAQYAGNDAARDLLPAVREVVAGYRDGTDFGIGMDADGLIHAGAPGLQLTWMDAKVGDRVVTPRRGRPVEINALWYHALRCLIDLEARAGGRPTDDWEALARRVATAFGKQFWFADGGYLYDVIADDGSPDAALRPNQIFAIGLPYPVLTGDRARSVLKVLGDRLLTPVGLRTLAPGSDGYCPHYGGDQAARDGAYHQGTVWPWLMGAYISAYVRLHRGSRRARAEAARLLDGLWQHVGDAGLNSVSEIFDADPPHAPRGCIGQAWSVAEVLRAYVEDILGRRPR